MSLKAIEMQVALPRTYDAGKIQEQQDQRGQLMNNHALQATLQEELKKRTSVVKGEEKGNVSNNNQQDRESADLPKGKKKRTQEELSLPDHPYKGNMIDYSG
ncbi:MULTISPECIES: hypothetical protein [Bacillaceae]|uniref:hypothetical protein n=1 Tax=Bacillaceae TaxID=186817 RepID=UPI001E4A96CC|nr:MULTISPECIES: hypothetical protein [Bacillaceae]MCE4048286.1 hypothetical protein [Bacillus sp. Au-Bac7]MCM3028959.1 hypothetical protein [Niallia sp. MER 6]MDL0434193.1 hypothetical protein [Niallia sp. SS-2023]UPO88950.1 hypothetical protein L8T27_007245 [Niallia sp. Man26]